MARTVNLPYDFLRAVFEAPATGEVSDDCPSAVPEHADPIEMSPDCLLEVLEARESQAYHLSWNSGGPMTGTVRVWSYGGYFLHYEDTNWEWTMLRGTSLEEALDWWDLWTVGDADESIYIDLDDEVVLKRLEPMQEAEGEWTTEINGVPVLLPQKKILKVGD